MKHVTLPPRQAQVARLLKRGLTQRQVADIMEISPRTVEHHVAKIREKTGLATTAAALSRVGARANEPSTSDVGDSH